PALYRTRTSISPTLQSPGSTAAARSRFRTAVRISQVEKGSSSAPLQRRQRLQHLLVVAVDADLLPHLAHGSRGVDQEGRALDAHGLLAVHVLLAPGAIGFGDLVIGVGEEGEVEGVLVAELAVTRHVVGGDAEDHGVLGPYLGAAVAEGAGLLGAARGVVLGVEVENDRLAAERGEPELLAVVGLQREIGRGRALFDPIESFRHAVSPRENG